MAQKNNYGWHDAPSADGSYAGQHSSGYSEKLAQQKLNQEAYAAQAAQAAMEEENRKRNTSDVLFLKKNAEQYVHAPDKAMYDMAKGPSGWAQGQADALRGQGYNSFISNFGRLQQLDALKRYQQTGQGAYGATLEGTAQREAMMRQAGNMALGGGGDAARALLGASEAGAGIAGEQAIAEAQRRLGIQQGYTGGLSGMRNLTQESIGAQDAYAAEREALARGWIGQGLQDKYGRYGLAQDYEATATQADLDRLAAAQQYEQAKQQAAAAKRGANQQMGVSTAMGVIGALGPLAFLLSDKRTKKDISEVKDSDVNEFLGKLNPSHFKYKGDDAEHSGIMAQDLEKSKMGKRAVVEIDGKKHVNLKELVPGMLASLANLHKRLVRS